MGQILSAIKSPFYRREMWNYVKWAIRNRCVWPAAKKFIGGLRRWKPVEEYPFKVIGEDAEITLRKHRFEWTDIAWSINSEADCISVLDSIMEWIHKYPPKEGTEGWDAYSASRRAINWVVLLSTLDGFGNGYNPVKMVNQSLLEHGSFILRNLEYRGEATNNHLIANAAALYLIGTHLGVEEYINPGRAILSTSTEGMFTEDGFLREGSTHYHLLSCQVFTRIMASANDANDKEFADLMGKHTLKMFGCAGILRKFDPLPLVGDNSPDSDPVTIMDGMERLGILPDSMDNAQAVVFPGSGYYRISMGLWKVFLYINPDGYVQPGSHGHDDILGFSIYHDGNPVLVDSGRSTYEDCHIGRYGRSVRAHNSLSIDGIGPSLVHAHNAHIQLILPEYYGSRTDIKCGFDHNLAAIRIEHKGFARIRPGIGVARFILMSDDLVVIEDRVDGKGRHLVEWFFHFHPSVNSHGEEFTLTSEEKGTLRRSVFNGIGGSNPAGWYSAKYGHCVPASTVIFSEKARLPITRRFTLKHSG